MNPAYIKDDTMELKTLNYGKLKQSGKAGMVDWLISLRSKADIDGQLYKAVHTEILFNNGLSFSATCQDACKCARIKRIEYTSDYWDSDPLDLTDAQEAIVWRSALALAGFSPDTALESIQWICSQEEDGCAYTNRALKYDLIGLLSFGTRFEIIRPHTDKIWCSEACAAVLSDVVLKMPKPDTLTPAGLRSFILTK